MKNSHQAVAFMAIPLTLAMTVNCSFAFFAAVVPKLWTIVEYMFPGAILAFLAIGIYALKIFVEYFTSFMIKGDFDYAKKQQPFSDDGNIRFLHDSCRLRCTCRHDTH